MSGAKRSLSDRTIDALGWAFSGATTQALLSVLVLAILARLLRPADFGLIGAALVVVGLSQIVSQLGLGAAIVQRRHLKESHIHVAFTLSIAVASSMCIVAVLLAPAIATFFRMPELEDMVRVLALVFPISGLAAVGQALLQREMAFKRIAAIDVTSYGLGYGLLGISLAYAGWGPWALVGAHVGQAAIGSALVLVVRRESIGFSTKRSEIGELLEFGTGFSLARFANYIASQADNVVVGRWLGADALGVYGRAYQCLMMPANFIGTVIDRVLFPAMVSVQDDQARLATAFRRATGIVAMFTLPLSSLVVILAPEIVWLLLGPSWSPVVTPLQTLSLVLVLRTEYKVGHSLARAVGAVYETAWRQWIYALSIFGGAWFGHFAGVEGVAIGVATAITINFLLTLHLSSTLVTFSWIEMLFVHFRHLTVAIAVGATAWGTKELVQAHGGHPLSILSSSLFASGSVLYLAWHYARGLFGEEGTWLHSTTTTRLQQLAVRLGIAKSS